MTPLTIGTSHEHPAPADLGPGVQPQIAQILKIWLIPPALLSPSSPPQTKIPKIGVIGGYLTGFPPATSVAIRASSRSPICEKMVYHALPPKLT